MATQLADTIDKDASMFCVMSKAGPQSRLPGEADELLGYSIDWHDGWTGKGRMCCHVSSSDYIKLRDMGFPITLDSRYHRRNGERKQR